MTLRERELIDKHFETFEGRVYYVELSRLEEQGVILLQEMSTKRQFAVTLRPDHLAQLTDVFKEVQVLGVLVFRVNENWQLQLAFSDGRRLHRWFTALRRHAGQALPEQEQDLSAEDSQVRGFYEQELYHNDFSEEFEP